MYELPARANSGGVADLLEVWGAVELSDPGIRAVSQPAHYFLHSLAAWAETPGEIITDWSKDSGADGNEACDMASVWSTCWNRNACRDPDADPIRITTVAQALIIKSGDPPRFLTQWDQQAGNYQLIGGRQKNDGWEEPIQDTAARELEEEQLAGSATLPMISRSNNSPKFEGKPRVSPTFGASDDLPLHLFPTNGTDIPPTSFIRPLLTRHDSPVTPPTANACEEIISFYWNERSGSVLTRLPPSFVNLKD